MKKYLKTKTANNKKKHSPEWRCPMKKRVILATVPVLVTVLIALAPSAYAGKSGRDVTKGVLIGTGAAILGAAIISNINDSGEFGRQGSSFEYSTISRRGHGYHNRYHNRYRYRHHDRYRPGRHHDRHRPGRGHGRSGYWIIEKTWIPPVYERRHGNFYDNGGHRGYRHGRRGIVSEGRWIKRKVWVSY